MSTLTRLLLVSACLLGASLAAMADELPVDTNKIKRLTPKQAQKLVATYGHPSLFLEGLTMLDADTAKAVASSQAWDGQLLNLTTIDSPDSVAIAQALATRKGPLSLPKIKKISPKTLTALIEKEDVQIPLIETLELIPEPDGGETDDFVVPKGFLQRPRSE